MVESIPYCIEYALLPVRNFQRRSWLTSNVCRASHARFIGIPFFRNLIWEKTTVNGRNLRGQNVLSCMTCESEYRGGSDKLHVFISVLILRTRKCYYNLENALGSVGLYMVMRKRYHGVKKEKSLNLLEWGHS